MVLADVLFVVGMMELVWGAYMIVAPKTTLTHVVGRTLAVGTADQPALLPVLARVGTQCDVPTLGGG